MRGQSLRDWYYRRILTNVPFILEHFDGEKGAFHCGDGRDHLYRHCLRPLAWLYANDGPGNRWLRDAAVLDKIARQGDCIVESATGSGSLGVEWIPYGLLECMEILGDALGGQRRARWAAAVARHIEDMLPVSNYISTAPNHFIWRAALLYRAGQMLDNSRWMDAARFLCRQIAGMQTLDGYWDEAHRGHGPSPHYHRTLLHGLDLYYRFSGDEAIKPVLYRAIDFAVRTAYPDGTPVETFDGRQPYLAAFAAGMAANALSRTSEGRRLLRLQCARLDKLGVTDATSPVGFAVTWYAFATTDFMLDCARFIEDGPEEHLPQEYEGHGDVFIFGGQQDEGGGLAHRRGPWYLVASAAESDVPRFVSNVYIAERQSGFSLWHEKAGVIIGGGNRMRDSVPLANAMVLTGWKGVDAPHGVFPHEPATRQSASDATPAPAPEAHPATGCYHPIRRRAEFAEGAVRLILDFLHARVTLDLDTIDSRSVAVRYAYETVAARKLLLQMPLPVFHPGRFLLDGREQSTADVSKIQTAPVEEELLVRARGRLVRYRPAAEAPFAFTWPLEPIKNWAFAGINYAPDEHFQPLYTVGLLSAEFTAPKGSGTLLMVEVG